MRVCVCLYPLGFLNSLFICLSFVFLHLFFGYEKCSSVLFVLSFWRKSVSYVLSLDKGLNLHCREAYNHACSTIQCNWFLFPFISNIGCALENKQSHFWKKKKTHSQVLSVIGSCLFSFLTYFHVPPFSCLSKCFLGMSEHCIMPSSDNWI